MRKTKKEGDSEYSTWDWDNGERVLMIRSRFNSYHHESEHKNNNSVTMFTKDTSQFLYSPDILKIPHEKWILFRDR